MEPDAIAQFVTWHLARAASSWSVGEIGVLAEFHHHGPTHVADRHTVRTGGGALRIHPHAGLRLLAYETPSANPRLWNHGVAFCLPEIDAGMAGRVRITEIGPDLEAIDQTDRLGLLFDLGLGMRTVDFMVRTADAALISVLRAAAGGTWFGDGALNAAIVAASPARVVASRLARVEITNPIPPPSGVSPDGPHTHLLPDLLRHHRVFDANIPVPHGMLPCLTLYPAHPARDAEGRERAFDASAHRAYQALLGVHGDPDYVEAKRGGAGHSRVAHLGRLIAGRQRGFLTDAGGLS